MCVRRIQVWRGVVLDREGRCRAARAPSGRLKTRAPGPETSLTRVCREAGATVRNATNVAVSAQDDRAIKVPATGIPLSFGANCQWTSHSGAR